MALTKIQPNIIAVANNVTNKTVGNTTSIPSFTFDGAGVVTSASNVAISGAGITANTVANSAFQTGSVENYLRANALDFGMRNRIINGAMRIDQRNAGANTTPAANAFTLDRWQINTAGTGVFSVQQDSSANTVAGFNSSLKVTSLAATTPGSGDNFGIRQQVEGLNWGDLAWGTASAKPVTLSFWVRSSVTGTFGGALENAATTRSYPFTYTINSANTWEYETITIPGDTTGTWSTDNGTGVRLWLSVGTGSTYNGTAGAWAGADYRSATGATQLVNTAGATWYITGIQLEEGSQPTPFEYRSYGTELALCQRYFEKSYDYGSIPGAVTAPGQHLSFANYGVTTTNYIGSGAVYFKITKRATPTIAVWDSSGNSGKCIRFSLGIGDSTNQSFQVGDIGLSNFNGYSTGDNRQGVAFHWTSNAEL